MFNNEGGSRMQMHLESEVVTDGLENRLENDSYLLELKGYHVYPLDKELLIYKKRLERPFGRVIINKIAWEKGVTFVVYNLVSLNTVN